jgi:hypothetical protein
MKSNKLKDVAKISKRDSEILEALQHGFIVVDAVVDGKECGIMFIKPGETAK